MIGWTFCSGIGAPEVAAPWVDWRLASEIEPFPRAVLIERFGCWDARHHLTGRRLWGDLTALRARHMRRLGISFPDMIVAGLPCQAFSVAGLRNGTADPRGNLTLQFVRTAHAIVNARPDGRLAILYENVPGLLSDRGNAFGAFLGGLVVADDELLPPEREWGFFHKPIFAGIDGERIEKASVGGTWGWKQISWPGAGMVSGPRARAAWRVLDAQHFGVPQRRRRLFAVVDFGNAVDPAAVLFERKGVPGDPAKGQEARQDVAPTISARPTGGGRLGTDFDLDGGLIPSWPANVAPTLNAHFGDKQGLEDQHALNGAGLFVPGLTHALRGEGFDASEDGTGRGTPLVPVAFDCKGTEVQYTTDGTHPTLRSMGHNASHANAGGHAAVAFDMRGREGGAVPEGPHDTANIRAASGGSSRSYIATTWAVRRLMPVETSRLQGFPDDHTAITYRGKPAADGPQYKAHGNSMAVPVIRWILDRVRVSWEAHQ